MSWVRILPPLPGFYFCDAMVGVAKWLTHRIVAPALVGSIPIAHPIVGESPSGKATDFDSVTRRFDPYLPSHFEPLAQLVEHLTFNQGVAGSSPAWLTTYKARCVREIGWQTGNSLPSDFAFVCESCAWASIISADRRKWTSQRESWGRARGAYGLVLQGTLPTLHSLQWLQLGSKNAVAPRFTAAAAPARIAIQGSLLRWRRSFREIPGKK